MTERGHPRQEGDAAAEEEGRADDDEEEDGGRDAMHADSRADRRGKEGRTVEVAVALNVSQMCRGDVVW